MSDERAPATAGRQPQPVRAEITAPPWRGYTALLRQLAAVRAADESRATTTQEAFGAMTAEVARLEPVLAEQGNQISDLARRLRLRRPSLTAVPENGEREPAEALRRAVTSATIAAEQARAAEHRARQPTLLPRWRPGPRNLLIYALWALVGLAVQVASFAAASNADSVPVARVLFVIPACAFLAGLVTVSTLGRSRIPPEPRPRSKGEPRPPSPNPRSVRMGLLVCFLTFPVYIAFLIVGRHLG